jgi:glyoxylase-like metal-dependent hydrolase (beta-lactamase superfamily II)
MTLDGTRSFVVGVREAVLVDPGPADPRQLEALRAAVPGRLRAVLLTHDHPDHAAGAEAVGQALGAPVRRGEGPGALRDGERFETDAGPLTAVATPGHAPDHFAFLWEGEAENARSVFVGDLLMGEGDTTVVMAPEGDLGAYLRSLEVVERLRPTRLYPAHGPPLDDPPGALDRYRRHRAERILQVEEALRRVGRARPGELLAEVYGADLDPRLAGAARGSLECVLDWLVAEGRAAREGALYLIESGGCER